METGADVTVILTVWKRDHLKEQIEALLSQDMPPANIWVNQCLNHLSVENILKEYPSVKYFYSGVDLKYFSRFSIAIHSPTCFTWVLDDDIIPAKSWIRTCIDACNKHNAIVASNGRIIPPDNFYPENATSQEYVDQYFIGDSKDIKTVNLCNEDTIIDFPCSSYFFRTEWLRFFWGIWPVTLETAEDIHFAATCKILGNIATVVPKQTSALNSGNLKPVYSVDEHSSWKRCGFTEQRSQVLEYFILRRGWKPILWQV